MCSGGCAFRSSNSARAFSFSLNVVTGGLADNMAGGLMSLMAFFFMDGFIRAPTLALHLRWASQALP